MAQKSRKKANGSGPDRRALTVRLPDRTHERLRKLAHRRSGQENRTFSLNDMIVELINAARA